MDTLNHEISRFDANLKKLVADKIQKEMKTALDSIVSESLTNIVGLKCNEFLNNVSDVVPICDKDYTSYVDLCKLLKCTTEPQEQVVYFRHEDKKGDANNYAQSLLFVIFKNGKIMFCTKNNSSHENWKLNSHFKLDMNHEPSKTLITLIDQCWKLYYRNHASQNAGFKIAGFDGMKLQTIDWRSSDGVSPHEIMRITIAPLIEVFQNEKPYRLNADVKEALQLEENLNIRDAFLNEREMVINTLWENYEQEKDNYMKIKEEEISEINLTLDECKSTKKQLMQKIIALERENKMLTKQLVEKTKLYDLLIDN